MDSTNPNPNTNYLNGFFPLAQGIREMQGTDSIEETDVPLPRTVPEEEADAFAFANLTDAEAQRIRDAQHAALSDRRQETLRNLKARIEAGEYGVAGEAIVRAVETRPRTAEQQAEQETISRGAFFNGDATQWRGGDVLAHLSEEERIREELRPGPIERAVYWMVAACMLFLAFRNLPGIRDWPGWR